MEKTKDALLNSIPLPKDPDALIFDSLPRGEGNAIHTKDILPIVGGTDRTLRKRSEIDRRNGYPAFSSRAGHWRPNGDVDAREADRASILHVRNYSLSKICAEYETIALCNRILDLMDLYPDSPLPDRFPPSETNQIQIVPPTDTRRDE